MQKKYLVQLVKLLNKRKISYVFTGGFVLAFYGFPRATGDIDVIVDGNRDKFAMFVDDLKQCNFDVSISDIDYAISHCEHFSVFYKGSMFPYFDFKVACDNDEFYSLTHYKLVKVNNVKCRIVEIEDFIVKKLEWGDIKDVEMLLRSKYDVDKLSDLAKRKGLYDKLSKLIDR